MPATPPRETAPLRNGPGRPRSGTQAQRRKDLLETARSLFLAHGLEAVPMAQIASSANVALRTVYQQYGSRRGLLAALIQLEDERHHEQLSGLDLAGLPWRQQLAVLALHVATRLRQPGLIRLMEITIGHGDAELVAAFERAGQGKVKALLSPILRDAIGSAALYGMHGPGQLCDFFIACISVASRGVHLADNDASTYARRGYDLFVGALDHAPENRDATPLERKASTT